MTLNTFGTEPCYGHLLSDELGPGGQLLKVLAERPPRARAVYHGPRRPFCKEPANLPPLSQLRISVFFALRGVVFFFFFRELSAIGAPIRAAFGNKAGRCRLVLPLGKAPSTRHAWLLTTAATPCEPSTGAGSEQTPPDMPESILRPRMEGLTSRCA